MSKREKRTLTSEQKDVRAIWGYIVAVILILGGLAVFMRQVLPKRYELWMGIVIVIAVGALMGLLFVMAAGFARLGLSDRQQALGLPEGSVRAMIALTLILIFIVVGIFLFREVGGTRGPEVKGVTADKLLEIRDDVMEAEPNEKNSETFDVTLRFDVPDASTDMAKQLVTTVGTLVVAVAGFYFGTRAVSAARGVAVPALPLIRRMEPDNNKDKEDPVQVIIYGKNFASPRGVKLVKDSEEIPGEGITWSVNKINCSFKFKGRPAGKYELVVVNEDGGEDRLLEAFEVVAVAPSVTGIDPPHGKGQVPVKIQGTGFVKGAQVKLTQAGQPEIPVAVEDKDITPTQIGCTFDLTGKAGTWNVVVINPDEQESKPVEFKVE